MWFVPIMLSFPCYVILGLNDSSLISSCFLYAFWLLGTQVKIASLLCVDILSTLSTYKAK